MAKNPPKGTGKDNRIRVDDVERVMIERYRTTGEEPDDIRVLHDADMTKVVAQLKAVKGKYRRAIDHVASIQSQLDIALSSTSQKSLIKPYKVKKHSKHGREAIANIIASDWHVGEDVQLASVSGMNEYSPTIADRRIKKFFQEAMDHVDLASNRYNINTIVLALLGDFINGYIHPEMEETNYMAPLEEVIFAQQRIIAGIDLILKETNIEQLVVPCCVGNHARTTLKSRAGSMVDNSFEYILYYNLSTHYEGDSRVQFVINKSYFAWVDMFDQFLVRFHHGDNVRYSGSIGGITVPARKAIANWNISRTAYLDIFGHHHTQTDGGNFLTNGSIVGYNAYALKIKAPFDSPKQTFFVMDSRDGKRLVDPILVE